MSPPRPVLATIRPNVRYFALFMSGMWICVMVFASATALYRGRSLELVASRTPVEFLIGCALTAFVVALIRPFALTVHREGIGGRDLSYMRVFVAWSEIAEVKPSSIGVKIVGLDPRSAIHVPEHVLADATLRRFAEELGGPSCPLLRAP
jgi:hypothetical protein